MAARITAAQARKLGIDPSIGKKRRVRRTARGPYLTKCKACGEVFTSRADEDRHLDETRHTNYLLILERN